MDSTRKQARIAGLLYALIAVTAPVGLIYVPGKLFVAGDVRAAISLSTFKKTMGMGTNPKIASCRARGLFTALNKP